MKPSELKSFIKEAVREAIQEELKDILLEAVRAPKAPIIETPVGVGGYGVATTSPSPTTSAAEKRAVMESIMGDMRRGQDTLSFNSMDARGMGINQTTMQVPTGAMPGGDLPAGNVGLDMIMGLMKGGK
jgi:hypothetical protein